MPESREFRAISRDFADGGTIIAAVDRSSPASEEADAALLDKLAERFGKDLSADGQG
ncbi:hypothetical protein JHN59_37075 [Streptomyces sp. MBT49]|uniref:hypothetical protein n=1 Tax=unclassified Streptomyces TaxID=2593676 RepID=UPI00190C0B25|nr:MULTISPECIES: hypothetical protein [unclassified Streptomyces]MBK3630314.1 hypothetical protein [Streptomyces sp. MBT49]MBK3634701.1 hypothetical protein [Streptomyces sp. MBT97]